MLFIIDGTGPTERPKYDTDMNRGFCKRIFFQSPYAIYARGPQNNGNADFAIASNMLSMIKQIHTASPNTPIVLVGHSRGAGCCIWIAQQLQNKVKNKNIDVTGMLLFDAVNRNFIGDANNWNIQTIPSNVLRLRHFIRDQNFGNYFENTNEYKALTAKGYDAGRNDDECLRYLQLVQNASNLRDNIRMSGIVDNFGDAGLHWKTHEDNNVARDGWWRRYKMGSHGAMGGAPNSPYNYIHPDSDAAKIEAIEIATMLNIQGEANDFLQSVQESANVRLDYNSNSTASQLRTTDHLQPKAIYNGKWGEDTISGLTTNAIDIFSSAWAYFDYKLPDGVSPPGHGKWTVALN